MSDPLHDNIVDALYAVQQEVGPLTRDASNPYYNSNFASFPAIRAKVDPIAMAHGLFVRQSLKGEVLRNRLYFNGEVEDDEEVTMLRQSDSPQGHGSATTFYRRYAYTTCLGLVSETDDDGNAASVPPAAATVHREPPTRPAEPLQAKAQALVANHANSGKIDEDF